MAQQRKVRHSSQIDPCPICHVPQAAHWQCRRCSSRGHVTGRAASDATLCQWCEIEIIGLSPEQQQEWIRLGAFPIVLPESETVTTAP